MEEQKVLVYLHKAQKGVEPNQVLLGIQIYLVKLFFFNRENDNPIHKIFTPPGKEPEIGKEHTESFNY